MSRSDSPLYAALLVAAAYAVFAYALLQFRHGDISAFVVAGGPNVDASRTPRELTVFGSGYDGMAFFRLALEPFTRTETAHGLTLDNPAYRQQRIGYPLLVWLLSGFGRVPLVLWLLVIVNVAAAGVIAFAGGVLARQFGLHAFWGVLFAMYPGFLLSLSRDTSEIVAAAFVLSGLAALGAHRQAFAACCLSFAVITRETTLVIVAALALESLRRVVIPIGVFIAWQLYLALQWGVVPIRAGAPSIVIPFSEYAHRVAAALPRVTHAQRFDLAECAFLALITLLTLCALFATRAPLSWRLAWLACLGLASILPHENWAEDWAYMRILADLFVLSALVIVAGRYTVTRAIALASTIALWWYVMSNLLDLAW